MRFERRLDRATAIAELADLGRIEACISLRAIVVACRGLDAWGGLVDRISRARADLGSACSVEAAISCLSVVAAANRLGRYGWRGFVGAWAEVAREIRRICGVPRGLSERTVREAFRVLEAAGLVERTTAGRGGLVEIGNGRSVRLLVARVVWTAEATEYWSLVESHRAANFADNSSGLESLSSKGSNNARLETTDRLACASVSSVERAEAARAVDAAPAGNSAAVPLSEARAVVAQSKPAESSAGAVEQPRARESQGPCQKRLTSYRPRRDAPNTLENARAAILWDLETWGLRNKVARLPEVLGVAARELSSDKLRDRLIDGHSGIGWDLWVWLWRSWSRSRREALIHRSIMPVLSARVRAAQIAAELRARGAAPRGRPVALPSAWKSARKNTADEADSISSCAEVIRGVFERMTAGRVEK